MSTTALLLNCDLGELDDKDSTVERALMPLIDMANIACGFHAGNPLCMQNTLAIAKAHGVTIGAHPGYGDRENFGRVSVPHTPAELTALLHYQISALEGMARTQGLVVEYVKPHGALYNDMMANGDILATVLMALGAHRGPTKLMLLATGDAARHRDLAARHDIALIFETFADRCYDDQGYLTPRHLPGAVHNHQQMLAQVRQLCEDSAVTTLSGKRLAIAADTLCIHGDTPDALATIGDIRLLLQSAHAGK